MDWSDLEQQVEEYDPDAHETAREKAAAKRTKAAQAPHKVSRIIGIILATILGISTLVLGYMVISINLLPAKYLFPALAVLLVIALGFGAAMISRKVKPAIKAPFFVLSGIFSLIYLFGIFYLNQTFSFFNNLNGQEYTVEEYHIIVKKDSPYQDIHDLRDKTVATFDEEIEVYQQAIKQLDALTKVNLEKVDSINNLPAALNDGSADAILISTVHKEMIAEEDTTKFFDSTRTLYTIKVRVKLETTETAKVNVSDEPFTVYISGIDAYGDIGDMTRGRSDVNMLATVNPKTHEVLLVSIPRDYYVQLHGTSGTRDKLTHAGIYGVQMSIDTLEDLLNIQIDYYLKVNFSTVTQLVDTIGGIDVYSDQRIVPWTNRNIVIPKGNVHMDGAMALAFARERKSYSTGDRHRVQNQQDVISAIIKKVSSSTVILTKYSEILNDLANCITTNIGKDEISSLVKLQLDTMPSWQIAEYSLNGSDSHNYTYSMGQQMLYVMEPDLATVQAAHDYIEGIIEGKTISELGIPQK